MYGCSDGQQHGFPRQFFATGQYKVLLEGSFVKPEWNTLTVYKGDEMLIDKEYLKDITCHIDNVVRDTVMISYYLFANLGDTSTILHDTSEVVTNNQVHLLYRYHYVDRSFLGKELSADSAIVEKARLIVFNKKQRVGIFDINQIRFDGSNLYFSTFDSLGKAMNAYEIVDTRENVQKVYIAYVSKMCTFGRKYSL